MGVKNTIWFTGRGQFRLVPHSTRCRIFTYTHIYILPMEWSQEKISVTELVGKSFAINMTRQKPCYAYMPASLRSRIRYCFLVVSGIRKLSRSNILIVSWCITFLWSHKEKQKWTSQILVYRRNKALSRYFRVIIACLLVPHFVLNSKYSHLTLISISTTLSLARAFLKLISRLRKGNI